MHATSVESLSIAVCDFLRPDWFVYCNPISGQYNLFRWQIYPRPYDNGCIFFSGAAATAAARYDASSSFISKSSDDDDDDDDDSEDRRSNLHICLRPSEHPSPASATGYGDFAWYWIVPPKILITIDSDERDLILKVYLLWHARPMTATIFECLLLLYPTKCLFCFEINSHQARRTDNPPS